jgi:hypothetical protein
MTKIRRYKTREELTPREMLASLREYEGVACIWPVIVGSARVAFWSLILPILGGLASVYVGDQGGSTPRIVLGVTVAVVLTKIGSVRATRSAWWQPLADRLWSYEDAGGADSSLPICVRDSDYERAARVLRRDKLTVGTTVGRPHPPTDAPWLDGQLWVHRPRAWPPRDGVDLREQAARVLRRAGIEARVAGLDVNFSRESGVESART